MAAPAFIAPIAAVTRPAAIRTAADWLSRTAARLRLPVPRHCSAVLGAAFPLPIQSLQRKPNALVADGPPLEASFVAGTDDVFRLDFEPGCSTDSPVERRDVAIKLFADLVGGAFDSGVSSAARCAAVALATSALGEPQRFGGFVGMTIGNEGFREAKLYSEWTTDVPAVIPRRLAAVVDTALSSIPGLVPLFASTSCTREHCAHRLYLLCNADFTMHTLVPAMEASGLSHRLPDAALRLAPFLCDGATAPRGSTVISFRDSPAGIECKVELLARALEIRADVLGNRVVQSMETHERAGRAYGRWVAAIGATTSDVNVIGVRIEHAQTAHLGVYVSPRFDRPQ
ncbi:hypothetical protein [Paraburkholderia dilworthii]|uniref:hypothetical protein n=1 Tax=Paraburkholderia dilworthii TaxID=948106 RepID=UPI00040CBB7C|nr:hypothetical protein [Paraburkholderia dilworthii]